MEPANNEGDFRSAAGTKKQPKAVADPAEVVLLASADIGAEPARVFRALFTSEVEKWWTIPGVYWLKEWQADLKANGPWSVKVELPDGRLFNE